MGFLAKVHISCFLLSYLAALGCEVFQVLRGRSTVVRSVMLGLSAAGFVAHTAYLISRSQEAGLPPLLTSSQDWLLVLAWLGTALYLWLTVTHGRLAHGIFLLPAVILLVLVSLASSETAVVALHRFALRRWGMLHASTLVLGIGSVVCTCIAALMYLLHHQKLKRRTAWLSRLQLPSLEQLSSMIRMSVATAVPFLTIGLLSGFVLLAIPRPELTRPAVRWSDPTIITSVVVWLVMTILLLRLLFSRNLTGKHVAQLALLSGAFLLLTFLGPMLLSQRGAIDSFHSGRTDHSTTERRTPPDGGAAQ